MTRRKQVTVPRHRARHRTGLAARSIVVGAMAVVLCGVAACTHNPSSHPAAKASLHAAASAAATNPAVITAQADVGQAIAAAFAPGQKHPVKTLLASLRSDPMFAIGAGRRDASCLVTWLLTHPHAGQVVVTGAATSCAQTGRP